MSGTITRSQSIMSPEEGLNRTISGDGPSNGANAGVSPLQLFVKAKKKINDIYKEVGEYVNEAQRFLNSTTHVENVIDEEETKRVEEYDRKVAAIREVLSRDHMKVVFFGRTSNGKSTAINALLGDKILPTGIGEIQYLETFDLSRSN